MTPLPPTYMQPPATIREIQPAKQELFVDPITRDVSLVGKLPTPPTRPKTRLERRTDKALVRRAMRAAATRARALARANA